MVIMKGSVHSGTLFTIKEIPCLKWGSNLGPLDQF